MIKLAIALIHFPIYDRNGRVSCTNITNFDIHDIARLARTYGLCAYYIVHPFPSQREVAQKIIQYWTSGKGGLLNPDRKEALTLVKVTSTLDEAKEDLRDQFGRWPYTVYTDARPLRNYVSYSRLRQKIRRSKSPGILVLGTGWGIAREEVEKADFFLEPIAHTSDYNHLSVRSAASIILDRIFRLK
jgi:hypothetical protein